MKRINEKTKKILYSLFAVGFIFLAVGVTYAFFNADFKGTYDNELAIGQNLIFRYDESEVGLNLTTDEILTDEDGITQDKYFDFEVGFETDTETSVNYYIYLTKDGTSTLEEDNIKIYLTDQNDNSLVEPTKISELVTHETYDNSRYLYGKKITSDNNVEEVNEYRIRVWAAETNQTITNTGDSHILEIAEQTYKFKVNVATGEMPKVEQDSSNANAPVLASNMIPVIYNNGNWEKADKMNTNLTWFNYSEKRWANAVTVTETNRDTYLKASTGTPIAMSDINTMLVWIPRFSATGDTANYNGGTQEAPGAFNITFVNKNTPAHDAFDFGGTVSGFWIGKFENSSNEDCVPESISDVGAGCNLTSIRPKILPNATSWRGAMVSTYFYDILAMTEEGNQYGFDKTIDTTLDTHMLKNNEWGAVAYLTQSIYGRCSSSTSCTEVGINNNLYFVTGYGAPAGSASTVTNGAYNTALGMDASTTGNIYGVYDMSGSAYEYVMGNYNNTAGSSQFTTLPNTKYYNVYTTESAYTNAGLQHALTETKNWYGDIANFVRSNAPWFLRGGHYSNTGNAGVFSFNRDNGHSLSSYGSRLSVTIN